VHWRKDQDKESEEPAHFYKLTNTDGTVSNFPHFTTNVPVPDHVTDVVRINDEEMLISHLTKDTSHRYTVAQPVNEKTDFLKRIPDKHLRKGQRVLKGYTQGSSVYGPKHEVDLAISKGRKVKPHGLKAISPRSQGNQSHRLLNSTDRDVDFQWPNGNVGIDNPTAADSAATQVQVASSSSSLRSTSSSSHNHSPKATDHALNPSSHKKQKHPQLKTTHASSSGDGGATKSSQKKLAYATSTPHSPPVAARANDITRAKLDAIRANSAGGIRSGGVNSKTQDHGVGTQSGGSSSSKPVNKPATAAVQAALTTHAVHASHVNSRGFKGRAKTSTATVRTNQHPPRK
jgi:hypothetical protein